MIICLGPLCVPCWPIFFLVMRPIWDLLPEHIREKLSHFWNTYIYPTCVAPILDRLPEKVKKFLLFGIRRARGGEEKKDDDKKKTETDKSSNCKDTDKSSCCPNGVCELSQTGSEEKKTDDVDTISTTDSDPQADTNEMRRRNVGKASSFPQGKVVTLASDDEFDEIVAPGTLSGYRAVYLDFTATWCKPCQGIKPVFTQLAEDHPDALFCMVDAEDCEEMHDKFGITCLPTIVRVVHNKGAEEGETSYSEKGRLQIVSEDKLKKFVAEH